MGRSTKPGGLGVEEAIDSTDTATGRQDKSTRGHDRQQRLFNDDENTTKPRWEEVNVAGVRVENTRQFGGPWLALHLIRMLQPDTFFQKAIPEGREQVPWDVSSLILIMARLLKPSSELYIAEQWYPKTALSDLPGVPAKQVDDNRLYRTLDVVLPHKESLEIHLRQRAGDLFELEYDLLMYDVTSTFFEGRADFPLPQRRYGKSQRIRVMDRGMVSEDNIKFLRDGVRRHIIGTRESDAEEVRTGDSQRRLACDPRWSRSKDRAVAKGR